MTIFLINTPAYDQLSNGIGTAFLILRVGDGVVANVVLNKNKGKQRRMDRHHGWLGHGCFVGVYIGCS